MCKSAFGPELPMVYASALGHVRAFHSLRMHGRATTVRRSAQESWGPSPGVTRSRKGLPRVRASAPEHVGVWAIARARAVA